MYTANFEVHLPQIGPADPARIELNKLYENLLDALMQLESIMTGQRGFSTTYLSDVRLCQLYKHGIYLIEACNYERAKDYGDSALNPDWLRKHIKFIDDELETTGQRFVDAASNGLIDDATLDTCSRKWESLEKFSTRARDALRTTKRAKTWLEMFLSLFRHAQEASETPKRVKTWLEIEAEIAAKPGSQAYKGNRFLAPFWLTFWLTVLATVFNIPTFAIAYKKSPPGPGTSGDSNFWLLLQSTIMQCASLAVTGLAAWNKPTISLWSWLVPTLLALTCSAGAIPLYMHSSVAWSSFATIVSSVVAAFVVVQLAVVGQ